jgi:hypothetical protein
VLVVGWLYLFDEGGRYRGVPESWVISVFTIVEPLARLSALSGALVLFFGLKRSASE